jgi:hypothetical protein
MLSVGCLAELLASRKREQSLLPSARSRHVIFQVFEMRS